MDSVKTVLLVIASGMILMATTEFPKCDDLPEFWLRLICRTCCTLLVYFAINIILIVASSKDFK